MRHFQETLGSEREGINKALKDKIIGSLERTAKLVEKGREQQTKPIKGKKQQMNTDDSDWDEEDMDDAVDVMENEEPDKVVLPMKPMAIEVGSEDGETGCTEKRAR